MMRQIVSSPFVIGMLMCLPLIILQACSSTSDPQSWYESNGPVIPHDSFPGDCSLCHEGDQWSLVKQDFEFDHLAETGVALEGAHEQAQCLRCHNDRGPVAAFAANGCAGCHEDVHLTQLGRNCESCHGQETWRPQGQIAQHSMTRFPLVGAHAAAACFRCHPGSEAGQFSPTDTACETCHSDLAANVTAPNHSAQGWLNDCQQCHMATSWRSVGGFGHNDWPLTGAHAAADCSSCHSSGQYTALNTACFSCHDVEFASTADPDHVGLGFSTSCQNCHSTNSWSGARFAHTGIINGCVTCHLSDYQSTTNPNHLASGYQTDCQDCHGTNTWQGAVFDHDFPITGNHGGLECIDCHTTNAPPTFECIDCHEHNQNDTNDEHSDVGGYSWSSPACLSCHPDGREQ